MRKNSLRLIFGLATIVLCLFIFESSYAASYSSSGYTASPDAIAVRVIPNPNHYSIARWYESQGFQGSPQALLVDGYEAIRDGRTVYVNAANINTQTKTIYTNIYLISYNQDSAPNTVDILGQIISHWKFNSNLAENFSPSCSISALSCSTDANCSKESACATTGIASSSCLLKKPVNCLVDADCPVNFFCNSLKARISRDLKRVGRLEEIREALFNFKKVNKHYPQLVSGTYLAGHSLSAWPSWSQGLLSDLAMSQSFLDPINRLGVCPGYDPKTCWNATSSKFFNNQSADADLVLPSGSYVLGYSTDSNGSRYNLCTVLESRLPATNSYMSSGYRFSLNDPVDSVCALAGITAGGNAANTSPQLISQALIGETGQEFNGYVKVFDYENNPLTWSLAYNASGWSGWSAPPVLKNTSNPNQKKIYAQRAGNPGTYNLSLTVNDGQGGILSTSTPIRILSSMVFVEADDAEYIVDPINLFNYSFSFGGSKVSPSSYSVTKTAGSFDLLNSLDDFTQTISTIGTNKYEVKYSGLIPTARKFYRDTDFKYNISIGGITKSFTIKVKPENPLLDFSCASAGRINNEYGCILGPRQQGNHSLYYLVTGLPANLLSVASSSSQLLQGVTTLATTSKISIKVINEYGASSTKAFVLKVNTYCGDGVKTYNTEGRGGAYNDGYEDCDGTSSVVASPAQSNISLQYGCSTTASSPRPYPIITADQCIFLSPVKGGGYCGDGYCQVKVNGNAMESCSNCASDCCQTGGSCLSNCSGRSCGSDGCGGSCGDCTTSQICNSAGNCVSSQCSLNTDCNDYNPCTTDSCANASSSSSTCVNTQNNSTTPCSFGVDYAATASSSAGTTVCISPNPAPCALESCRVQGTKTCTGGAYGTCNTGDPRHNYCIGKCESERFYCKGTYCSYESSNYNSQYPCKGTCVGTGNQHACAYKAEIKDCYTLLGMPAGSFYGTAPCNSDCSGYDSSQCVPNICNSSFTSCQDQCNTDYSNCTDPDCGLDRYWCVTDCGSNQTCLAGCEATYYQCEAIPTCSAVLSSCLQQCGPSSNCYWYRVPEAEDNRLTVGMTCMVKMNIDSNKHIICDDSQPNSNAQWFRGSIAKDKDYGTGSNKVKICSVTGCTTTVNPNKCRYYDGNWSDHCLVHKTW